MNVITPRGFADRRYYHPDRYSDQLNSHYYPNFRTNNRGNNYLNNFSSTYGNNGYYNPNHNTNHNQNYKSYPVNNMCPYQYQTNQPGYFPNHNQRSLAPRDCVVDVHEKRVRCFDPVSGAPENVHSKTVRVVQPYGEACRYERLSKSRGVTSQVTMERSVEAVSDTRCRSPPVFIEKLSVNIKVSFTEPGSGRQRVMHQKCVLQGVKPVFIQPTFHCPRY